MQVVFRDGISTKGGKKRDYIQKKDLEVKNKIQMANAFYFRNK